MASSGNYLRFLLNGSLVELTGIDPHRTLLDWLRGRLAPGQEVRARAYRALNRLTGAGLAAGPTVHPLRLAFRVHMARVMVERLRADATLLAPARAAA